MSETTKIQWAHHTFNPWIGCTKVDEACRNCYAEAQNTFRKWNGGTWGPGAPRKRTSTSNWMQVLRWNREAREAGERRRVFCASLADVFDQEAQAGARSDLWATIEACPDLDWLLLTKRPQNIRRMVPEEWLKEPRPHVWFGTSVGDQAGADERIPELLKVPAAVRFLSVEPLIGRVSFRWARWAPFVGASHLDGLRGIHWIIVGGESGGGARPMQLEWARNVVEQCQDAKVPVFVKQLGARPAMDAAVWRDTNPKPLLTPRSEDSIIKDAGLVQLALGDRKHGGVPAEWPEDLRVREFPR